MKLRALYQAAALIAEFGAAAGLSARGQAMEMDRSGRRLATEFGRRCCGR